MSRYFAKNGMLSVASGIAGQAFLILSGVLAARYLGPEGRGHLAIIMLAVILLCSISTLGLPLAFARQLAAGVLPVREGIMTAWKLYAMQTLCCMALYVSVVAILFPSFFPNLNLRPVSWAVLAVIGWMAIQYGVGLLQGLHQHQVLSSLRVLQPALYALFLIALLPFDKRLEEVAFVWSLSVILGGGAFLLVVIHKARSYLPTRAVTKSDLADLFRFGRKSLLGNLSPFEILRLDQVLLAFFFQPHVLGIYVVAQAFTNLPRLIAYGLGLVLLPAAAAENNRPGMQRTFRTFVIASATGSLVVGGFLFILMPALVMLFFGEAFESAASVAQVLLAGAILGALRKTIADGLIGLGNSAAGSLGEMMMYPWFALLAIVLVPRYDVLGMATAVTVSQIPALGLVVFFMVRDSGKFAQRS